VVVCDVEVGLVDDCQGVWAVDLGVRGGFEMGRGVLFGPEAEGFEAGAGLGVVYYVEGAAWVVVFDPEGVEVGVGEGEVEEFDGGGFGVRGGVVVDVEVALGLGMVEDALCWFVSTMSCFVVEMSPPDGGTCRTMAAKSSPSLECRWIAGP
jgi:hypothetical protein